MQREDNFFFSIKNIIIKEFKNLKKGNFVISLLCLGQKHSCQPICWCKAYSVSI